MSTTPRYLKIRQINDLMNCVGDAEKVTEVRWSNGSQTLQKVRFTMESIN